MDKSQDDEHKFGIRLEARVKNSRLIEAREKLELTQEQAAKFIGISQTTLGNYELMRSYPSVEIQNQICEFYRANGQFLLEEDVFPNQLKKTKFPRKFIREGEIPKEDLVSLSQTRSYQNLLSYQPREEVLAGETKDIKEVVDYVLSTLTPREEKVLKMRFGIGEGYNYTLEDTGKYFDVTIERIRQIEAKALRKLRHPFRANKLKSFYFED